MEHATRRILHANVTVHPTCQWTMQQLREAIPSDHPYRFLIHDRDRMFSQQLDQCARALGLRVLKTPWQSPQAKGLCERLLGTLRRQCLDFLIPLTMGHLRDWSATRLPVRARCPGASRPGRWGRPHHCIGWPIHDCAMCSSLLLMGLTPGISSAHSTLMLTDRLGGASAAYRGEASLAFTRLTAL